MLIPSRVHLLSMRTAYAPVLIAVFFCLFIVPASAENLLTINATPSAIIKGGTVTFSGTVVGEKTIAVYLFIVGPGLDSRGVTLENLNIPAGRGLFTTAPANLSDGCWSYIWDTSAIVGTLEQGNYTVYVVDSPVDRLRFQKENFGTTTISILPGPGETPSPVDPLLPFIAVCSGVIFSLVLGNRKKGS